MGTTANVLVGSAAITIDAAPVGYTVDGADLSIRTEFANIKVEENIGTIIRKITDQEVEVTLKLAEGTLANLASAIPGSSLAVATLTIGGGALADIELVLVGEAPSGGTRTITLPHANPVGEVGIPFKKGEISVVPVTFAALVSDLGVFGTIVDS
jgi:hypothetical protein